MKLKWAFSISTHGLKFFFFSPSLSTSSPPTKKKKKKNSSLLAASAPSRSSSRRSSSFLVPRAAAETTTADVAALAKKFDIPGSVAVIAGRGGLPTVRLTHACGATAEVILFGGLVSSWTQPSGDEVLYIRPDAVFDRSKPVSGGIPHCFPQFGPGKMQQHGFARNLDWAVAATSADPNPDELDPSVEIVLPEHDYTKKMGPHSFRASFTVTLHGEALKTELAVTNTGNSEFDFTAALHSYIEVLDIRKAKVRGLKGFEYLDKTVDAENPPKKKETRDEVDFTGPVDAVYLKAGGHVELDVGTGAAVAISSDRWDDVVVWSPWTAMEACYERFCCVENAQFSSPAGPVKPGGVWRATAEFSVVDLE